MAIIQAKSFVGIDVSKKTLDICILPPKERFQIENGRFEELCNYLKAFSPELIVLESTGGYEVGAYQALHEAGFRVSRENAQKIYHHRKSRGKRAKTDGIDAETIADYAQCRINDITAHGPVSQAQEALRQLLERREELVQIQTAEKNRLQAPSLNLEIKTGCQRLLDVLKEEIEDLNQLIQTKIEERGDW